MTNSRVHPEPEKPFDASNPEHVKQVEADAIRREKNDREVLVALLSSQPGRAWLWRFFSATHMTATSFDNDALAMAFKEGERNVGLKLWTRASEVAPDLVLLMLNERGAA